MSAQIFVPERVTWRERELFFPGSHNPKYGRATAAVGSTVWAHRGAQTEVGPVSWTCQLAGRYHPSCDARNFKMFGT
jgi:hypothetical protein